jgi:murein L,D-transpeptidase YafK
MRIWLFGACRRFSNAITINLLLCVCVSLYACASNAAEVIDPLFLKSADAVLVKKKERALYLLRGGKILRVYNIMLGPKAVGPKLMEGDERTPEGRYTLDRKNPHSRFYKSIRVSYPNEYDLERAHQYNVEPGGAIMIHGMKNSWNEKTAKEALKFNWTDGCIAVKNSDMDEIWDAVDVGTPIEIQP